MLTRIWLILGMLVVLLIVTGCDRSALGEQSARERLRNQYVEASNNGDFEALKRLFHWENVDPRYRQLIEISIRNDLPIPVRRITFSTLLPEDSIQFEFRGMPYVQNLEPRLRMTIEYDSEDFYTSAYLIGFVDGEYRIVNAMPRDGLVPPPVRE